MVIKRTTSMGLTIQRQRWLDDDLIRNRDYDKREEELNGKYFHPIRNCSECIFGLEAVEFLKRVLPEKYNNSSFELIYRATEVGSSPTDFHRECDDKGATLTLFLLENGDCIACFTSVSWSSFGGFKTDPSAMIINLSK